MLGRRVPPVFAALAALLAASIGCAPARTDDLAPSSPTVEPAAPRVSETETIADEPAVDESLAAADDDEIIDESDAWAQSYEYAANPAAKTKPRRSTVIGALDDAGCLKELKKLKIPYDKAPGAPRIDQPIILRGPINGIHFDTGRPYKQRTIAFGDAMDCRLAVALYDLAKVVKKHGIGTVLVKSFHRPTQPIVDPNAPLRHRIGFAIDIAGFKTKKGVTWSVVKDFHGKIGQQTCGSSAAKPIPETKISKAIWKTFCDVVETKSFDSGISPNYNASHFDHVHFDLTTDHPLLFFP